MYNLVDLQSELARIRSNKPKGKRIMRETLAQIYLDWRNNYISVDVFAEHNGLTYSEAVQLIELAKSCFENPHPDA